MARWVFDLLFFFVIQVLTINIFFGLIIDAFADIREERAEKLADSDRRCFICGINKEIFDRRNLSWAQHIYVDHNLHSYLAYMLYCRNKLTVQCNGVEKRVKEACIQNKIDFFPMNDCIRMRELDEKEKEKTK